MNGHVRLDWTAGTYTPSTTTTKKPTTGHYYNPYSTHVMKPHGKLGKNMNTKIFPSLYIGSPERICRNQANFLLQRLDLFLQRIINSEQILEKEIHFLLDLGKNKILFS